jgi:hypothetical protein
MELPRFPIRPHISQKNAGADSLNEQFCLLAFGLGEELLG